MNQRQFHVRSGVAHGCRLVVAWLFGVLDDDHKRLHGARVVPEDTTNFVGLSYERLG